MSTTSASASPQSAFAPSQTDAVDCGATPFFGGSFRVPLRLAAEFHDYRERILRTPPHLNEQHCDDYWMTNDPLDVGDYVHQATEMVAAQLDCDIAEALGRLRIRATATGQTLENLSLDVLDGLVRFS
jgi:hypothetical protein